MQNKLLKQAFILLFLGVIQSASASPEQEGVYLRQLIHQIDAMKETVFAAEREQSKTARIQFHYTAYRDHMGQEHSGVWEDLQKIRAGIEEKLAIEKNAPLEIRTPEPVEGDYRDEDHREKVGKTDE